MGDEAVIKVTFLVCVTVVIVAGIAANAFVSYLRSKRNG